MTRTSASVLIVLGAAVWPGETPSPTLRRRAQTAGKAYLDGKADLIIASGGLGTHPPTEAEMIIRLLTDMGIPNAALLAEDRSRSTLENLQNALPLVPNGAQVTLVSDLYHLPRARLTARRLGRRCKGLAPPLKGAHPGRLTRAILREIPALLWYMLRPIRSKFG